MKDNAPINSMEARRAEKRRRRRRRRMIRTATVLIVVAFLLTVIVWSIIEVAKASKGESASFFGVKAIEVEFVDGEGTVRYSPEEIIRASGIFINQSLLAVNKVQASNQVLQQFPYLDYVEVKNSSFSTVCIGVSEAKVLAALQTGEDWLIVGENNHILERVATENLPADLPRIVGVTALSEQLGGDALDERSLRICSTVLGAVETCGLEGVSVLDISEKTNLRFWWKDRLDVVLGNESNLAEQVTAFNRLLPTLIEKNGDSVSGQLDMTSYADDKTENDRAVFTPTDALKKPQTSTTDESQDADSTTDGTAANGTTFAAA